VEKQGFKIKRENLDGFYDMNERGSIYGDKNIDSYRRYKLPIKIIQIFYTSLYNHFTERECCVGLDNL